MDVELIVSSAMTPTENAQCERAGGEWKTHAKALMKEFGIDFTDRDQMLWLCSVLNWAKNSTIGPSGYSPSQWVLGRNIKLPYQLLSQHKLLSMHERALEEPEFARLIGMLSAAQRSINTLQYILKLSKAFLPRAQAGPTTPIQAELCLCGQALGVARPMAAGTT